MTTEGTGVDAGELLQFSQRLRRLREAAGLTQEDLAERAGLSVKAIGALETGRRQRPYPHTVRALADALGLSEDARAELAGSAPKRERTPAVAAPARPLLPSAPTSLIGRERELVEVSGLLRGGTARMVTLTGPGGVGKTRLALEVAADLSDAFPGAVGFVPLALVGDAGLVLPMVAQAIGLEETGATSVREMLVARLGNQPSLLVFDNVEHVLAIAPEVADLLASCPGLMLLVTSRAPLRIRAEHEYPVRPLALPELSRVPTLEEVAPVSSVQLFVERARAAAPDFELTQANCAAVAAVCRRLDGLPLALELVAARVRVLSPTELLARLDRLLPLLVGGSRDLPERQQTMRAAIDWSHELLAPSQQALFRRLSVFAGGWTLEAAEAVTAWGEIAAEDVIELLSGLVEQSLVVAEASTQGTTRYRMLEMIRQFAAGRVEDAGETMALAERRLHWCLSLAQLAASELRGAGQQIWLNRLEAEHDNLRAALAWCEQDVARGAAGLQLAAALWRFWSTRGYLTEGRRWLESALSASDDAPPAVRAEGLNAAGNLARDQGDHIYSAELHEAALALRRALGDRRGVAMSLNNIGTALADQGEYHLAALRYDEALAIFRELALEWEIAIALHNLGIAHGIRGEYEQAVSLLEEALALWDSLGESNSRARSLDALGEVVRRRADLDRAEALHETSLALRRELGDTRGTAISLRNLGLIAHYRGDNALAVRLMEESLQLNEKLGNRRGVALTRGILASAVLQQGDTQRALELYGEALDMDREIGTNVGVADCLLGLAAIAAQAGDGERAARLLGASDVVREATDEAVAPVDRPGYERIVTIIEASLSPADFVTARAAGSALTQEDAIAEALSDD
ncbi:MAG TPA: tetratricopeptide repeat protein [Thermomicrobiales bacterium]|nr:tetratricopeptide repeat protein [Thermomicrobiales bacterium]